MIKTLVAGLLCPATLERKKKIQLKLLDRCLNMCSFESLTFLALSVTVSTGSRMDSTHHHLIERRSLTKQCNVYNLRHEAKCNWRSAQPAGDVYVFAVGVYMTHRWDAPHLAIEKKLF